jgi:hypothetical protein
MAEETWERYAWVAGIAAIVLFVVATFIAGTPPHPNDSVRKVFDYVNNNKGDIKWGGFIVGLGIVLLAFWVAALASTIRGALKSASGPVMLVIVGASVALGLALVGTAVANFEALQIRNLQGGVYLFFVLNYVLGAVGAFGTAVLVVGVSLAVFRTDVLPKWLGPAGLAVALLQLVAGVGVATLSNTIAVITLIAFLVWAVWVVAISVLLLARSTAGPVAAPVGTVTSPTPPPPPASTPPSAPSS